MGFIVLPTLTQKRLQVSLPKMKLILNQKLGNPNSPYMKRWAFITKYFSIRIHHWFTGDDDRYFHDHPWNFICIVIKGSYDIHLD